MMMDNIRQVNLVDYAACSGMTLNKKPISQFQEHLQTRPSSLEDRYQTPSLYCGFGRSLAELSETHVAKPFLKRSRANLEVLCPEASRLLHFTTSSQVARKEHYTTKSIDG